MIEVIGQLGAKEAVAGGDGIMDLAEAGKGDVSKAAADAIANGQGADEDGGGDDDAEKGAEMAAGVEEEIAAEKRKHGR